jgi:hypothetical protein
MTTNPYAAPVEVEAWQSPVAKTQGPLATSIFRWTVICGVCAGPTLFVACSLFHEPAQLAAIGCASAMFVAAFVWLERNQSSQWCERLPHLRSALRAGFIARMAISILFPIGMMIDMLNGMVSLSILEAVLSSTVADDDGIGLSPLGGGGPLPIFFLTLVDGFLLIGEVAIFMVLAYFALWVANRLGLTSSHRQAKWDG